MQQSLGWFTRRGGLTTSAYSFSAQTSFAKEAFGNEEHNLRFMPLEITARSQVLLRCLREQDLHKVVLSCHFAFQLLAMCWWPQ